MSDSEYGNLVDNGWFSSVLEKSQCHGASWLPGSWRKKHVSANQTMFHMLGPFKQWTIRHGIGH